MTTDNTTSVDETTLFLGEAWSDPIEVGIRDRIRSFIEALIEEELAVALGRRRYERGRDETPSASATSPTAAGYRHGHRQRRLTGSFGTVGIAVPRARWCARLGV